MKKYLTLKNLGWLFVGIVSFFLGSSGVSKLLGSEEMVGNFTAMNLLPYMALVGVLEVIGVILLWIPKTSSYGAVLVSLIMSGAASIHLAMFGGAGILMPVILGALALTSHCLRNK